MGARKARGRGRPRKDIQTPLSRWVDATKLKREDAARLFDITRQHLDRLCRGDRTPSLALALEIERITRGAVSVQSWGKTKSHSRD